MRKNIQMPLSFFYDVCDLMYMLQFEKLDFNTISLCSSLKSQILDKFDSLDKHGSLTNYKFATPGSLERKGLRRSYHYLHGMFNNWTSKRGMFL